MNGIAHFKDISHGMKKYEEHGTYNFGGSEQSFYQNQTYIFKENHFLILKQDGQLLHEFHLHKKDEFPLLLHHTHSCQDDQYILSFCITSPHAFSTQYLVIGPHKEYEIKTYFTREAS